LSEPGGGLSDSHHASDENLQITGVKKDSGPYTFVNNDRFTAVQLRS